MPFPSGPDLLLAVVRKATEGEYAVESEIGRGGMAAVFLATDLALDRRVAIKVMLPDLEAVAENADRFLIEARAAARLDHPGIVTVYSVKHRDGLLFIVMKYIGGRTLDALLTAPAEIPLAVAAGLIGHLAEALHFAHGEGVVHRDVKPSNVLLDARGRPVITDFGIAKVTTSPSITLTGALIGTPAYMSPEQCRGLPATVLSDQYSLGVLAYELLARRRPFTGSLFELIHAHCDDAPTPLSLLRTDVDAELADAVMRMLSKNPRDRWPHLGDVSRLFLHGSGLTAGMTHVRHDASRMAGTKAAGAEPGHRHAIAIDMTRQDTEQVTTPVPALVITPANPTVEVGASITLRLSESSGASLAGIQIVWRSEDPSVAVVDAEGHVKGVGVGLAKISAAAGPALGRATVTVKAAEVDALVVTPQKAEFEAEDQLALVVTALDARGNVMPTPDVVWVSSDVAVCVVSERGVAHGVAAGKAVVTARFGEVAGTATVRVRPTTVARVVVEPGELGIEVDEKRQVLATVFGSRDRALPGRTLTWKSSAPTVATVDASGLVQALEPGTAAIVASSEGKEGICSVTVRSQPVAAVRIQPARLQLELGRSLQLHAVAEDRRGRPMPNHSLEWRSDDSALVLIDSSGKVHGAAIGKTTVRARADGAVSAIEVEVVPRPVAQMYIASHQPTLEIGGHLALHVLLLDSEGGTLTGRDVRWASSDHAVARVDGKGVVEARRSGTATITATCGVVRTTTTLSVPAVVPAPAAPPALEGDHAAAASALASPVSSEPAREPPVEPERGAPAVRRRISAPVIAGSVLVVATLAVGWGLLRPRGPLAGGAEGTAPPAVGDTARVGVETPAASAASGGVGQGAAPLLGAPGRTPTVPRGGDAAGGVAAATPLRSGAPVGRGVPPSAASERATATEPVTAAPSGVARTDSARTQAAGVAGGDVKPAATAAVAPPQRTDSTPGRVADSAARVAPSTAGRPPAAAPSLAEPSRPGTSEPVRRAVQCGEGSAAAAAVSAALRANPAQRLLDVYVPQDEADRAMEQALAAVVRDVQRLRVDARPVRAEVVGDHCEWVMALDLNWTNAFGQPRRRSVQLRAEFDVSGGGPQFKRLFGARGL